MASRSYNPANEQRTEYAITPGDQADLRELSSDAQNLNERILAGDPKFSATVIDLKHSKDATLSMLECQNRAPEGTSCKKEFAMQFVVEPFSEQEGRVIYGRSDAGTKHRSACDILARCYISKRMNAIVAIPTGHNELISHSVLLDWTPPPKMSRQAVLGLLKMIRADLAHKNTQAQQSASLPGWRIELAASQSNLWAFEHLLESMDSDG